MQALPLGILLMKSCALAFVARSSILGAKRRHTDVGGSLQDPELSNTLNSRGTLDMNRGFLLHVLEQNLVGISITATVRSPYNPLSRKPKAPQNPGNPEIEQTN